MPNGICEASGAVTPVVCDWEAGQLWEGLRGVEEVWHYPFVSCLFVHVLKVLNCNRRSSVRELSLKDLYHSTLLCSSCFARVSIYIIHFI